VAFLLVALVMSATGIAVVVLRNRRPTGVEAGIADFERSLQAIAPRRRDRAERGHRADRGGGPG
jgi:hypothetical protein